MISINKYLSNMVNNKLKIAIFIPAYNAAATLPGVLGRIPPEVRNEVQEIIVVDNCSRDNTYYVALGYKMLNNDCKLTIFRNKKNYGYGGSQKIAYQYVIENNYDLVAMLHGDAQYAPEYLADLFKPFRLDNTVDMAFGSRMKGNPLKGGMPLYRFLGNKILTRLQNIILKTSFTEFHSGFRVFNCRSLKRIPFTYLSDDYHFDTEIIIQILQAGMKIIEIPIPTHYGDEKCYVRVWEYGFNVLQATIKYFLHEKGLMHFHQFDRTNKPDIGTYKALTERIL